jgi:hypothetical protein
MRKLMIAFSACAFFMTGTAFAAEQQQMDESTNPNTNTDVKTQNMQQKPNSAYDDNLIKPSKERNTTPSKTKNKNNRIDDSTAAGSETEKLRQKPE